MAAKPLSRLFGGVRARVLEVLLQTDTQMTVRHIARLADASPTAASQALAVFEGLQLVSRQEAGPAVLYRLRRGNLLVEPLVELMRRARTTEETVARRTVEVLASPAPTSLVLFGSLARGEAKPSSDMDLLVVAPDEDSEERYRRGAARLEQELGEIAAREVNVVVAKAPTGKAEARSPFWKNVAREGRVLYGEPMGDLLGETKPAKP